MYYFMDVVIRCAGGDGQAHQLVGDSVGNREVIIGQ